MLIDLSHTIVEGMTTYPGLAGPVLKDVLSRDVSAERFGGIRMHIGKVCMVANTGTYLDVPFHYYEDLAELASFPIEGFVDLPGVYVDATKAPSRAITPDYFTIDVSGKAVLVHTGWDRHFGTEQYGVDAPYLPSETVDALLSRGAALVGIDSVNIDSIDDPTRPAHCGFLAAGTLIVEHLVGLGQLADQPSFSFTAVPPKFAALGTFPVRAFARCPE